MSPVLAVRCCVQCNTAPPPTVWLLGQPLGADCELGLPAQQKEVPSLKESQTAASLATTVLQGLVVPMRHATPAFHSFPAVGEYFSASCVPGASGDRYPPSLCELCKGDGAGHGKCEPSPTELYYDYLGAFRCVKWGGGHVKRVPDCHSLTAPLQIL